jgi:hypothetical protein
MTQNCYRCDSELDQPVEKHANYVRGDDTTETVKKEIIIERRHSTYTRAIRDRLQRDHGLNATQANNVISRNDENYLRQGMSHDVGDSAFETAEVVAPSSPAEDPEVVRVDSKTVERETQKTGLVCESCLRDGDEVIW